MVADLGDSILPTWETILVGLRGAILPIGRLHGSSQVISSGLSNRLHSRRCT